MGYNSEGNFFANHPANGFPNVGRIISCTRYMITNGGRGKRQATPVQEIQRPSGGCPADPALQMAKQRCIDIAGFDDGLFMDINTLRDVNGDNVTILSKCPTTKAQLLISTEFIEFSVQAGDCHKSRNSFRSRAYNFVSVCCYDTNG